MITYKDELNTKYGLISILCSANLQKRRSVGGTQKFCLYLRLTFCCLCVNT